MQSPEEDCRYQKHAVLENLSICIWIMNTLKMLQIHSSDHFWNTFVTFDKATSFIPFLTKLFSLVLSWQLFTHTHNPNTLCPSSSSSSSHSSFWMECVTPFWLVMLSLECALSSRKTVGAGQRCLLLLSLSVLENTLCGGRHKLPCGRTKRSRSSALVKVHWVHKYIAKNPIKLKQDTG